MEVYYTRCLIEGNPCLFAFDYGSDNNVGGETKVTHKLSSELSMDQFQYRAMCERSIM